MILTNAERFETALREAYTDLFANNPDYAYSAAHTTPEVLAAKMTAGLQVHNGANKDGDGIKRACKAMGIKHTYAAIRGFLAGVR